LGAEVKPLTPDVLFRSTEMGPEVPEISLAWEKTLVAWVTTIEPSSRVSFDFEIPRLQQIRRHVLLILVLSHPILELNGMLILRWGQPQFFANFVK